VGVTGAPNARAAAGGGAAKAAHSAGKNVVNTIKKWRP
jgi:hypothetical protein